MEETEPKDYSLEDCKKIYNQRKRMLYMLYDGYLKEAQKHITTLSILDHSALGEKAILFQKPMPRPQLSPLPNLPTKENLQKAIKEITQKQTNLNNHLNLLEKTTQDNAEKIKAEVDERISLII